MEDTNETTDGFAALGLPESLVRAVAQVGYESPSPIQSATIPPLLAGRDVLGQAQTGTGKTAAFALPILARLEREASAPQALVLAPTRELAIQVAEAFQRYAAHIPGFHVLPIYGGQSYGPQLGGLKRGTHVVVGTPGRVIDHLKRGSLDLSALRFLVLDEADEMLRMGFIDDVEAILEKTPATRQTALFSATMPPPIRRIADRYLRDPAELTIASKTKTATNVRQRYWLVSGLHKLDALTRILEAEPFEAMIVFARTKQATEELADRLAARGFAAAAINGDIEQKIRERTIGKLREGSIDILVATDVAARGLDVERVSHVVNYDIPYDPESYVHRIGRTGRAGRSGEAILFVTPRERNMLRVIERTTRQPVEPMTVPSVEAVNDRRIVKFMQKITATREAGGLEPFERLVEAYERDHDVPAREIAAVLAKLAHGNKPLLLEASDPRAHVERREERATREASGAARERRPTPETGERPARPRASRAAEAGMANYRVAVGRSHGVKPGNLVGAIANEAGLDAAQIGRIEIHDRFSVVGLPEALPAETLRHLGQVRVAGERLRIAPWVGELPAGDAPRRTGAASRAARPAREGRTAAARPYKPRER